MSILDAMQRVGKNLNTAKKMIKNGKREAGIYLSEANYDLLDMEYGGFGPIETARYKDKIDQLRKKYRELDEQYHRMVGSNEGCD